jgi:hypothetical protein
MGAVTQKMTCIVRPNLFDDTVTADRYHHVHQEEFLQFFKGMGVSFGETYFSVELGLATH